MWSWFCFEGILSKSGRSEASNKITEYFKVFCTICFCFVRIWHVFFFFFLVVYLSPDLALRSLTTMCILDLESLTSGLNLWLVLTLPWGFLSANVFNLFFFLYKKQYCKWCQFDPGSVRKIRGMCHCQIPIYLSTFFIYLLWHNLFIFSNKLINV